MLDKQNKEWRELTFSQREGEAPLPEPLQAGKLTREFRNGIWRLIETSISNCSEMITFDDHIFSSRGAGKFWQAFSSSYSYNILGMPHDESHIDITTPWKVKRWLKELILQGESHEVLTGVEHMLRTLSIPKKLAHDIESEFKFSLYLIDRLDEPVCIISTTSQEMKESIKQSLNRINKSELIGARTHLRKASQELRKNDFSASIRESIHAVEAAVRQIDPRTSNSFSAALDSLEKNGMIKHPALKAGFKKLYDYTSDEDGIRHSLIDKEASNVGLDEANFMYSACVSFVDYLASKHKQLKKNDHS